jgi:hypothetical protein
LIIFRQNIQNLQEDWSSAFHFQFICQYFGINLSKYPLQQFGRLFPKKRRPQKSAGNEEPNRVFSPSLDLLFFFLSQSDRKKGLATTELRALFSDGNRDRRRQNEWMVGGAKCICRQFSAALSRIP